MTNTTPAMSSSQDKLIQALDHLERTLANQSVGLLQQRQQQDVAPTNNTTDAVLQAATTLIHSNPSKLVKRWLGSISATASNATLADLSFAAQTKLDPFDATTATGRDLLLQLSPPVEAAAAVASQDVTMETDTPAKDEKEEIDRYLQVAAREAECFLLSLAVRLLWRNHRATEALALSQTAIRITLLHMEEASKNTYGVGTAYGLYPLLARLYRYQSLVAESCAPGFHLEQQERAGLVQAHRMAVIRKDVDTQAVLLNIMLRNLLNANQVDQAHKLLSNSTFPENASNNQLCRHLYYSGRIKALRLEYTSAFSNLSQCLRKSPTNTGVGFRIAVQRLLIVVQLLMGEIPDRSVFSTHGMKMELTPYMKITQAVRRGDLAVFHETVQQFMDRLKVDGTYTLISRLAHSVVKAGLRRLNMSYSRISLEDIAHRLGLANATSAEFVVSKAVRDGVIDATIYHEEGYVQSHDLLDVYATTEPMEAFHRRIAYCLTTHNDAVRSMRYPPDEYKKQLEASRGMRGKKDDKTEEEKAQELEDELDDDY
mmetsp:Transcript_1481/g.2690  ORF Transcript_1481/g.2690 Transcript_1481/m.2690 type:complete len:542 (+) Transcript_1481:60-1685(+)|eukprot:CAMPEP_0176503576 /NCGR_PEP_ID=MMETSP0200_2-20121128/15438_1 /TAXON_ID=947934 /ORGANISM="Chaetoceros sp., Strain GSL56" /LENGTH=541 /DNA_ID=CAMNT_0017902879 /DNA_START=32 /DNA_END=1657 /DNA_ORIENTATION=-